MQSKAIDVSAYLVLVYADWREATRRLILFAVKELTIGSSRLQLWVGLTGVYERYSLELSVYFLIYNISSNQSHLIISVRIIFITNYLPDWSLNLLSYSVTLSTTSPNIYSSVSYPNSNFNFFADHLKFADTKISLSWFHLFSYCPTPHSIRMIKNLSGIHLLHLIHELSSKFDCFSGFQQQKSKEETYY